MESSVDPEITIENVEELDTAYEDLKQIENDIETKYRDLEREKNNLDLDIEAIDNYISTEFKLVSLLVNRIILDSIKIHKTKNITKTRKEKRRRRHRQRKAEQRRNDGEMIPYPRVG